MKNYYYHCITSILEVDAARTEPEAIADPAVAVGVALAAGSLTDGSM